MLRRDQQLLGFALVAALVSAGYWALWIVTDSSGALALTLVLHVTAALLTAVLVEKRRRSLAIALGLVVPIFGPFAAALSTLISGRGGTDLLHDPDAVPARIDGADVARRLTTSMPVCEALASTDVEARRQALTKLKTRGAAEDITVLRWARTQQGGDAAVEVALAFEELSSRFEERAAAARALATTTPTYASLSSLFLLLAAGITSGVVDAQLVGRYAAEASRHHAAAVALDPERAQELLGSRVRVELATHRPAEALALLADPALDLAADSELGALYREAAYAARRFDLVPELARGLA